MDTGTWKVKTSLAQMLKGGVIMDVVTPEQAKIAEAAGVKIRSSHRETEVQITPIDRESVKVKIP